MFNKETLGELTESILYVNLLLAILALIALYDQRAVNKSDDGKKKLWEKGIEEQLDALSLRVEAIEEYLSNENKNI